MCKWNKHGDTRIDPCLRKLVSNLKWALKEDIKVVACCCGHGKYPMTIIIKVGGCVYDLVSGRYIPREKRFYKRDKKGVYYVPEVSKI